jgi:hypothetical protein
MMTALMTGRNAMEIMWKREKVTRRVLKTLRRMITAALKWTWTLQTTLFNGKNMKCGKIKRPTHIRSRWQNILTKLLGVIAQTQKVNTSFETWNGPLQVVLDNISHQTNHYIFNLQPNFSHWSNAELTLRT